MLDFYRNKKVFITGHTGFKGSWLTKMLTMAGADVTGYALSPGEDEPSLFRIAGLDRDMHSVIGDIRDLDALMKAFKETRPDIVIHMAAQPLVRDSYKMPRYTYETNVMGTVNILECVRACDCVGSVLNVTTDKVYENIETDRGYQENDKLDGYDPYSNSKSCSELVTHSYKKSYFDDAGIPVSTARAGNVIGGGDFSKDRIIPDCVRAATEGETIVVRNPEAVRPFQLVLDPLYAYLLIVQKQYEDKKLAGYYNVGPDDADCITVAELADLFCRAWGDGCSWEARPVDGPHEANLLRLDCSRIRQELGWSPRYDIRTAIEKTVEWSKVYAGGGDVSAVMEKQIVT
ncbi:MAG: CDP-glucose 4,6-dehydratase [Lachnospiraceae bacterium]|nr:CDP-glucose 4,6-dehydratase [Lachnospiraceae bacterium]